EVSMLDTTLALHLMRAVDEGTHVLLVGDADQLPSVSAGNVLHDIISSRAFPTTELDTIFRQAQDSAIVRNAHKIKHGDFPELPPHPTDFYFIEKSELEEVRDEIVSLVTKRIPKEFGFSPKDDVQVMAPLYKTKAGVTELNEQIQNVLNPKSSKKNEIRVGFTVFREGDRVMQLRNNYDKDVYNGDVGVITGVTNGENLEVSVAYSSSALRSEAPVIYKNDEVREITLAYAVSVHKSQGSEYPVVVMPVVTSHFIMLQRNLLYTAVTRAKKLVILVGQKKAVFIALKNDKPQKRYSGLVNQLSK
ncbi:ATP-binding domain-containing protein, partial [candidate division WWE3 bacterium]|nr:ATP-binding domain-containing protein [candidate division WWE3 bacterium]